MGKSRKVFLLAKEERQKNLTSKFDPNPAVIVAMEQERIQVETKSQDERILTKPDKKATRAKASSYKSLAIKDQKSAGKTKRLKTESATATRVSEPEKQKTSLPLIDTPVVSTPVADVKATPKEIKEPEIATPEVPKCTPPLAVSKPEPIPSFSQPSDDVFGYIPEEEIAFEEDRRYLWIGKEYKIQGRTGSAYRLLFRIVAKRCNFLRVARILDSGKFDPEVPEQAKRLLEMAMVKRDLIEPTMRADTGWLSHAMHRANLIKGRAERGNEKAKVTLVNPSRMDGGKWLGNVTEMISVCCGSYKPAWQRARGLQADKRKDSDKLVEAGIVVRKFPRRECKENQMYLMMFLERHFTKIEVAIRTVYKIDESLTEK